jgi:hypothetical protein
MTQFYVKYFFNSTTEQVPYLNHAGSGVSYGDDDVMKGMSGTINKTL